MQIKTKIVLSTTLDRIGVVGLLRRAVASRSGLVLSLHRVLPPEERSLCYDPHLALSEPAFVSLLRLLQQDYDVVHLEDLLADPRGTAGRPKVAITFDDGWEDNYRVAFPHLLAYQMPATIFACTELVDTTSLLPEERFARLWNQCDSISMLEQLLADLKHWGMGKHKIHPSLPQKRYWSQELKQMPLTARLLLLDHLEQRYQVLPVTSRRFLGWEDIRIMMRTGLVHMGSHTARHATLTSETDRDIRRELEDSRTTFLKHTGVVPEILAYPNGMHNQRVIEFAGSAGFKAAFGTHLGLMSRRSNLFSIPRIAVEDSTVSNANAQFSVSGTSVYFLSSGLRSVLSF